MNGNPFFGFKKPQIVYPPAIETASDITRLPPPARAVYLIPHLPVDAGTTDGAPVKSGDPVKTGQRLHVPDAGRGYAVAGICGAVVAVSPFTGDYGRTYTAVTVEAAGQAGRDDTWEQAAGDADIARARSFLEALPGAPCFAPFTAPDHGIHTIVILGMDKDLMVATQRRIIATRSDMLKTGIHALKTLTGVEKIVLAVARDRVQGHGELGATVVAVDNRYPSAFPQMIMKDVLGTVVPAGSTPETQGVAFFTAEAVASLGTALSEKQLPTRKVLTFIHKDGRQLLLEVELGTPVKDILAAVGERLADRDRLIFGGPMTGAAVYSDMHPVCPDTDAIVLQDSAAIAPISDTPCINCGECIRACPAQIPINLLVRFLEAGAYQDAAALYDLHSCIGCGLCSYVCVAGIPVFQYIRLATHELKRTQAAEAVHV